MYLKTYHHHHHQKTFMELGHLLTRSGLTYPEVASQVYHDSFCQLESSGSLPWVIYFEAFYLNVVSSFSSILVICPKLVLFLTPLQFVHETLRYKTTEFFVEYLHKFYYYFVHLSLSLTIKSLKFCSIFQVRYK
jgi:hypothetical protein